MWMRFILTGGEDDQISVKTKSYVQALIPIYLLALHLVGDATLKSYWLDQINLAAQGAHHFLQEQWGQIKQLAENYAKAPNVFVLGTGPNLGTAEEASLKIIEMAKMYSECQELRTSFMAAYEKWIRTVRYFSSLHKVKPVNGF